MRVELPRDEYAEFRDLADLKGGDAKAIRRATKFRVEDGVLNEITMGLQDDQMDALLCRIITSWSLQLYGLPMADPSSLDEIPLDTYNALCEAAKPYKEAIDAAGKSSTVKGIESTGSSSPETPQPSKPSVVQATVEPETVPEQVPDTEPELIPAPRYL
jgi:hypothetical protein